LDINYQITIKCAIVLKPKFFRELNIACVEAVRYRPKGKEMDGFHKPHETTEPNAVQPPSLSASASPTQGLIPEGDVLVVTSQDKLRLIFMMLRGPSLPR